MYINSEDINCAIRILELRVKLLDLNTKYFKRIIPSFKSEIKLLDQELYWLMKAHQNMISFIALTLGHRYYSKKS